MHRDTILTPATVIACALLALAPWGVGPSLGTSAMAQGNPAGQSRPQGQSQTPAQVQTQPAGQPQAAPAAQPPAQGPSRAGGAGQVSGTGGGRGAAQVGRSRRPSYAACNRMSHARGLRGGARRRFLIRCKLGYDRPRAGQPQPAPARQP
ncbi:MULTISPECIES: hypothetical protein [Methylobacterium]|uniref:hypothetical protein n=1 Tax=Methylobacterium TaxID=407 RepID=UPI0009EC302B|nr:MULTISPECIES: hypothetical protein [Methylobacterium]MCI9879454.1 serine/threonine protein kinase [Methylobacterium goesingense]